MACENTSGKVLKCALFIILPILAVSIVALVLFPTLYTTLLKKELALNKGTLATEIWQDIPLPIYEKLYFFNITNVRGFLRHNEKLNVSEVGPYTYKSRWVKDDIEWDSDATVSYKELRIYHFQPDLSNGSEEDIIYTLNGPMIIAAALSKNYDVKIRALLSTLLGIAGEELIIKRSIKQLAYGGYEDLIIKFAPVLKSDIPYKDGIFCWLYGKNNTDDGLFRVFTGSDDPTKTGIINKWNGRDLLQYWKGDSCNKLNGTSIEYGPPIQNDQNSYTFFQSIFCRSLTLNYTEETSHFDIPSKRFRPTYSLFANSTENPDNYCFETEREIASGLLDVSSCQFGAPLYISFPHFYMADPSYLNPINGLNPNDKEHGSFLDVELVTGFTIDSVVRFQINVDISSVKGIFQTYDVINGIFPVLWVELRLEIDEYFANYLKTKTITPKIIAYSVLGVLAGVSLILAVVFIVILYLRKTKSDTDDSLLDAVDEEHNTIANGKKYSKISSNGNNSKEKLTKVNEVDEVDEESTDNLHSDSEKTRLLK